jgi:hypothetical protein
MLRVAVLDDHPAKPAKPAKRAGTQPRLDSRPATDRRGYAHSAPGLETTHEVTARDACATAPPD